MVWGVGVSVEGINFILCHLADFTVRLIVNSLSGFALSNKKTRGTHPLTMIKHILDIL